MKLGWAWLGAMLALSACGDDAHSRPDSGLDSGFDANLPGHDSGPPPMCASAAVCGSPLAGQACCTRASDVDRGTALAVGMCGAELGELVPALDGQCVQLRQPGTLDSKCPARQVGNLTEPGCCTSAGACGTWNEAAGLGCQRLLSPGGAVVACGVAPIDAGAEADAD